MSPTSPDKLPALRQRIQLLNDGCNTVIDNRRLALSEAGQNSAMIKAEFRKVQVLSQLTGLAVELSLIGEEIAIISGYAMFGAVNSENGHTQIKPAFGIIGKLTGFKVIDAYSPSDTDGVNFAYAVELPEVTFKNNWSSGIVTPYGLSPVSKSMLCVPDLIPPQLKPNGSIIL